MNYENVRKIIMSEILFSGKSVFTMMGFIKKVGESSPHLYQIVSELVICGTLKGISPLCSSNLFHHELTYSL